LNIKEVYSFTQEQTNLTGQVFVITGKLAHFKNRDELKEKIEACGGKVAGSISGKTNYLINNDINSGSSKNLSAKKLNIPIITEKDFIDQFNIR
jgi:DNA ligase (NAD+)